MNGAIGSPVYGTSQPVITFISIPISISEPYAWHRRDSHFKYYGIGEHCPGLKPSIAVF